MDSLLIVGASARAAAYSALRAGLHPCCIDLFADADLIAACPCIPLSARRYPEAILDLQRQAPPGPWMYTGAIENYPRLIRQLGRTRGLWGNEGAAVCRARSPMFVQRLLQDAGIPCPKVVMAADTLPTDGTWLVKPLRGAAGRGIEKWRGNLRRPRWVYYQQFIDGLPCAAVYVGGTERAQFLGATQQLVGEPWLHAADFHYCGSIGPLVLDDDVSTAFERLGDLLTEGCGLRGLFGVDCILRDGVPFPVEINPRYTASVEVIEHGSGIQALSLHRAVFERSGAPSAEPTNRWTEMSRCLGKAILFARKPLVFPVAGPWSDMLEHAAPPDRLPAFADLPVAGQQIEQNRPVLSFFASAASPAACRSELQRIAMDLDHWLLQR